MSSSNTPQKFHQFLLHSNLSALIQLFHHFLHFLTEGHFGVALGHTRLDRLHTEDVLLERIIINIVVAQVSVQLALAVTLQRGFVSGHRRRFLLSAGGWRRWFCRRIVGKYQDRQKSRQADASKNR